MTTALSSLTNFIGGEPSSTADHEPVLNPATGEPIAEAPLSTQNDVDRAVAAARAAFPEWATKTPGERAEALLGLAAAIEARTDELAELEAANAGKPINAFRDDEIPFMVDNLRFFAGAARCLEGKAAGEYLEGHTSIIPARARRRHRPDRALEHPLMMAVWKIGPALAARQHDRPQACRDDAGHDRPPGRDRQRGPARPGRAQRRLRPRRRRRDDRRPRRRGHGLDHRLGRVG